MLSLSYLALPCPWGGAQDRELHWPTASLFSCAPDPRRDPPAASMALQPGCNAPLSLSHEKKEKKWTRPFKMREIRCCCIAHFFCADSEFADRQTSILSFHFHPCVSGNFRDDVSSFIHPLFSLSASFATSVCLQSCKHPCDITLIAHVWLFCVLACL